MTTALKAGSLTERRPVHIVLIEDEPGDVYMLEEVLKHQKIDYKLTVFEDGDAALSGIPGDTSLMPDLVLLDLNLPKRDGFEILHAIRSRPALVGIPVGIFTSSEAAGDRNRVALLGAERYIHKPQELNDFIEQVGEAISDLLGPLVNKH